MKKFIVTDNSQLRHAFQEIHLELMKSKTVTIQVTSPRGKSNEQLGYYWGVVLPTIRDYLNEQGLASARITDSDLNEVMNQKFFYKEIVIDGEIQKVVRSKAQASVDEMSQFITDVINWATNLGIFIPPSPVDDIK